MNRLSTFVIALLAGTGIALAAGWNGSGSFSFTHDFTDDRDAGINISASRMDQQFDDARVGLENTITRDGQNSPSANLPMGGYAHTGVADGTARNQYASVGQVQDSDNVYAAGAGTVDAITASFSPTITALVDGMSLIVRASGKNTSHTPTLNINGIGAKTITRQGGKKLCPGDITGADHNLIVVYDSGNDEFELQNPGTDASPAGTLMPYAGAALPDGCWLWANGQTLDAVTNTYYQDLYDAISHTAFGGTGNSSFQVPDLRGRVPAGKDNMGGTTSQERLTGQSGGVDGDTLGAPGGAETHTLTEAQLAVHDHTGDATVNLSSRATDDAGTSFNHVASFGSESVDNAGSGAAHNNVQPTIILNYIIRY